MPVFVFIIKVILNYLFFISAANILKISTLVVFLAYFTFFNYK